MDVYTYAARFELFKAHAVKSKLDAPNDDVSSVILQEIEKDTMLFFNNNTQATDLDYPEKLNIYTLFISFLKELMKKESAKKNDGVNKSTQFFRLPKKTEPEIVPNVAPLSFKEYL